MFTYTLNLEHYFVFLHLQRTLTRDQLHKRCKQLIYLENCMHKVYRSESMI